MNPEVLALLQQIRGKADATAKYRHMNFIVTEDEGGITYSQMMTDADGNSLNISERRVHAKASQQPSSPPQAQNPQQGNGQQS